MRAEENKFTKYLWLVLALTFPFFTHDYFRLEVGPLKPPIALFILGLLGMVHTVLLLRSKNKFPDPFSKIGYLLTGVLLAYLSWHFLSIAFFGAAELALSAVIKLAIGYFVMLVVVLFFPRDQVLLEKFWFVVIWASAIGMGIFIYHSYVDFNSPYLVNKWELQTRSGRNQMTWYLSFVLPIAVSSLWDSKGIYIKLLSNLVLFIALFYAGSRSALLAVFFGIMAMVFFKVLFEGVKSIKRILPFILLGGIVMAGAWFVIIVNVEDAEMVKRFDTLAPGNISSLEEDGRYALIQRGLNHFYSSPFTGIGLGQSRIKGTFNDDLTHNDYLKLLSELGIPGFLMFISIIMCIFLKMWPLETNESGQVFWVFLGSMSSMVSVVFSLFFINAYSAPLLWIYFGFVLVGRDIEKRSKMKVAPMKKLLRRPVSTQ